MPIILSSRPAHTLRRMETTSPPVPSITSLTGVPGARRDSVRCGTRTIDRYVAEFWTARQRQASLPRRAPYRACFKPQLPRFFIERLTEPGDLVYDPFSGRGTTALEAALLDRRVAANDVNPLSALLAAPRLAPPASADAVAIRIAEYAFDSAARADLDLSMFYHPTTEAALVSLRRALLARVAAGTDDDLDRWIRMVATNRLTGHSRGSSRSTPSRRTRRPRRPASSGSTRVASRFRRSGTYPHSWSARPGSSSAASTTTAGPGSSAVGGTPGS